MISVAYAQDAANTASQSGAAGFASFIPMILIFAVFYLLLIRPQQKQQKQHQKMVADARKGDKIVTSGGIHGKITGVKDNCVLVEIANGIEVKMERAHIQTIEGYEAGSKKAA